MPASYDFKDRTAVVTGAVRGIGWATARRLLEGGAQVAIWDIDQEAISRKLRDEGGRYGHRLAGFVADVTRTESVHKAVEATRAKLGHVSILVNNAVQVYPELPALEVPDEQWLRMLDVNVVGVARCFRALVPAMVEAGYGRVVNMGSVAGQMGSVKISAYSATKAAVINFTKTVGRELAGTGVLVNAVAPGGTHTDGMAKMSSEQRAAIEGAIPLKRMAQPDEISAIVTWLCSDECTFSTGATFDASGGRSVI